MDSKKLYIKNMVCNRCITVVKAELDKLGLEADSIKLGEIDLHKELEKEQKQKLNALKILEVIWKLSIIKRLRVKSSEPLLFLVGDTGFEPVTSSV